MMAKNGEKTAVNVNENGRAVLTKDSQRVLGIETGETVSLTVEHDGEEVAAHVSVDDSGRWTVPKPVRELLGIDGEDAVIKVGRQ